MRFVALELAGAFAIYPEPREDSRGLFARTYCAREFVAHGIAANFVQCNTSFNKSRGVLRGMHYQAVPHPESKLVRCTQGAIYDVLLDLRSSSPTFCKWVAMELSAENRIALYVPPGFAHGFQVLSSTAEVHYQMGEYYSPELARGVRWNDPAFGIQWPIEGPLLSEKDSSYQDFDPLIFNSGAGG